MIEPTDRAVTRERLLRAQLHEDEVVEAIVVLDHLGSAFVTSERIMTGAMGTGKPGGTTWGVLSIPWRLVTSVEVIESDQPGASQVCVGYERPSPAKRGTTPTSHTSNTAVWACDDAEDAQRLSKLISARLEPRQLEGVAGA